MTVKTSATLQDRFAESILQTLQEIAPKMMEEEFDYDSVTNFMWSCTMALNGLIQKESFLTGQFTELVTN